MSEEILKNIDAKLGVIAGLIERYLGEDTKPAAVKLAEKVLEAGNAVVDTIAPAPQVTEEPTTPLDPNVLDEEFDVGDIVVYVGDRKKDLKGIIGTITEAKPRSPWFTVLIDGNPVSVRKSEITKKLSEQPPALSHEEEVAVEKHLEDQQEASEGSIIKIDEEAAAYRLEAGICKDYRNIHAAYTDPKKGEGNRRYLRYRAKKVFKGDEHAKEMCHRYLVSVQDAEYLAGVSA